MWRQWWYSTPQPSVVVDHTCSNNQLSAAGALTSPHWRRHPRSSSLRHFTNQQVDQPTEQQLIKQKARKTTTNTGSNSYEMPLKATIHSQIPSGAATDASLHGSVCPGQENKDEEEKCCGIKLPGAIACLHPHPN